MVGNPIMPSDQRTVDRYFSVNSTTNPGVSMAFAMPTPLVCTGNTCAPLSVANIGNAPTAVFRGPGPKNWDMTLFKDIRITERFRSQLRFEAYNVFNHTQFNAIDTTITFDGSPTSKTYGQNTRATSGNVTSARDPRILQLSIRFSF